MSKNELYTRLSTGAISYTLTVLFSAVLGLASHGASNALDSLFLLELLGLIVLIQLLDIASDRLFRGKTISNTRYWLISSFVIFIVVFGAGWLLNWFGLRLSNILLVAAACFGINGSVISYLVKKNRLDAKMINEKLSGGE